MTPPPFRTLSDDLRLLARMLTRCLWRSRRRLTICAILLFVTGIISFWRIHAVGLMVPLPLIGGLSYFILFWPVMLGVVILLPWFRSMCEISAVSMFILSVAGQFYPPLWFAEQDPRLIYAFIWLSIGLFLIYTTKLLDRLFVRKNHSYRLSAATRLSAPELWAGLVGTLPFDPPLAYTDILTFARLTAGTSDRRVVTRWDKLAVSVEHHFVEIEERHHHFRFRWRSFYAVPDSMWSSGTQDLRIIDKGRRRVIIRHSTVNSHPWRAVVLNWIDDSMGRLFDGYLYQLENRDPDPPTPVTSPWQVA